MQRRSRKSQSSSDGESVRDSMCGVGSFHPVNLRSNYRFVLLYACGKSQIVSSIVLGEKDGVVSESCRDACLLAEPVVISSVCIRCMCVESND